MATDPQHKPSPTPSRFRLPLNKWTGGLAAVGAGLILFAVPQPASNVHVGAGVVNTSCTTTLTSGGNVNAAITNAVGGAIICLDAGTYTINTSASKSSTVTVKSTTGVSAVISSLQATNTNNLKFDSLTIHTLDVGGSSTNNLTISNNVQTANSNTAYWEVSCNGMSGSKNIVLDGNNHTNTSMQTVVGSLEGRLSIGGGGGLSGDQANCGGLIIKNSLFKGAGGSLGNNYCSDGIFLQAGNIVIGPGNVFRDLSQTNCVEHIDAIQCYDCESGIYVNGNFFYNNTVILGWYDGYDGAGLLPFEFTNNTAQDCVGGGYDSWMGSFDDVLISHNTFKNCSFQAGNKSGFPANVRWIIENNNFDGGDLEGYGGPPVSNCGADCIVRYNLRSNGATLSPAGTNNVIGTAVYTGTPLSIANWAFYLLSGGSPGKSAGNDGFDMGTLFYGPYTGP
jgi:hypothetical protein